jgi:hypothetical protein
MTVAIYPALFFSVVLLVTTAYFLMGGLPLLILKHDTSIDAKFIRSFFNVYCKGVFYAAIGASVSCALWGRFAFAVGTAAIALVAVALRRRRRFASGASSSACSRAPTRCACRRRAEHVYDRCRKEPQCRPSNPKSRSISCRPSPMPGTATTQPP